MVLTAPAKLNLTLEVIARLPNGYHALRSVFLSVAGLADTIELDVDPTRRGIHVASDSTEIPDGPENICYRAAALYLERTGRTVHVGVHISKRIPVAAGLGGGSSNAASVLLGLNDHFGRPLSEVELAALGSTIGKDVPFFLSKACAAHVSGMGEIVTPLGASPDVELLVVFPRIRVSTAEAYARIAERVWFMAEPARADRSRDMAEATQAGNRTAMAAALYNDFELVIEALHPAVRDIRQALLAFGATGASMSGSGPTVFGLFASREAADNARHALERHDRRLVIHACRSAA